jgi:hypothetical protein
LKTLAYFQDHLTGDPSNKFKPIHAALPRPSLLRGLISALRCFIFISRRIAGVDGLLPANALRVVMPR